jgi:hypothetical protein
VWQFFRDGPPEQLASVLAQHDLGILLKTHDGTDWMSRYDASLYAVSGPEQAAVLASYYERYGVPFHAWCVLKGLDPQREAEMGAQVIAAGARSLTIDVEPHGGFWQGTPQDALTFGREFRRRQPNAILYVSVDPRPWALDRIPLTEFASFAQGFIPQIYWETFNSSDNVRRFESSGFPPGGGGITPEFLLDVTQSLLHSYGSPIQPAGQGASTDHNAWRRFVDRAFVLGMGAMSVWRYGVTGGNVWQLLREIGPPRPSRGVSAVIAHTNSCLNVRQAPTLTASIGTCLPDGTPIKVRDGPAEADGYRWWVIEAGTTRGWSAEGEPGGVRWLVPLP